MDEAKSLKAVNRVASLGFCFVIFKNYLSDSSNFWQISRDKAAELDKRLDSLLSGFPNFKSSIRSELRFLIAQGLSDSVT
ncbi:unnamed protein product [Gongylonema pulchrum]|uniref:Four helix bundle protein n=1 Tax=Gongylonema pulchrum TaxID=637853 RepID=A0A183EF24_9BILA|nr:unnamed protein product [Gongylonema pulchrum]